MRLLEWLQISNLARNQNLNPSPRLFAHLERGGASGPQPKCDGLGMSGTVIAIITTYLYFCYRYYYQRGVLFGGSVCVLFFLHVRRKPEVSKGHTLRAGPVRSWTRATFRI